MAVLPMPCNLQVRGVSGGEKKRVTTGEIIVGSQRFMAMDEISTGRSHLFLVGTPALAPKQCSSSCHPDYLYACLVLLQGSTFCCSC
jgi:hypothetical protein